jgi:hypothetical protein
MIAFSKWFKRTDPKPIRIQWPSHFVLIRGADKESINAVFDENDRIKTLIVHTRQK